eukprot:450703_1
MTSCSIDELEALWEQSSHKTWVMKSDDVKKVRKHVYSVSVSQLAERTNRTAPFKLPENRKRKAEEMTLPSPSPSPENSSSESSNSLSRSSKSESPEPLTMEEEATLRAGYEKQIWDICRHLELPTSVKATATAFFKRFYLYNSVMDRDPELMLCMCVFMATKTEERWIKIEKIAELVSRETSDIVSLEVPLLEGIKFNLLIFHPYRPLNGFMDEMKSLKLSAPGDLLPAAHAFIEACLCSDCALSYAPSVVALAALSHSARERKLDTVDRYISLQFASRPDYKQLQDRIADVEKQILIEREARKKSSSKKANKQLRRIVRKLKKCRNPEFVKDSPDSSSRYNTLQENKESERNRVRDEKCEKIAKIRKAELATLFEPRPGVEPAADFAIKRCASYDRPEPSREDEESIPQLNPCILPMDALLGGDMFEMPPFKKPKLK